VPKTQARELLDADGGKPGAVMRNDTSGVKCCARATRCLLVEACILTHDIRILSHRLRFVNTFLGFCSVGFIGRP